MNPDYCNHLPSRQVPPDWAENVFVIRRVAELEKKQLGEIIKCSRTTQGSL